MLDGLYIVFVEPLLQIYGMLFTLPTDLIGNGGRIIVFSVLLNLLLLPIYFQMERKSRSGAALRQKVAREVARIKRHFRGRERFFYIRAAHRQHGYRPVSHLTASGDLWLQILVFATVYRYLSGLESLVGSSFGPLRDLSKPDGLVGGINLLPLLMTGINAAAVFSYVEDTTRRTQALLLALLFLVLLYNSASGLVLYWTTNSLFSLARTRIQRRLAAQPDGKCRRWLADLQRQQ